MSKETTQTIKITDDYGNSHTYVYQMMPTGKGFRTLIKIIRMAGGAVGRSFGAFSASMIGEKVQEIASVLDSGMDGEAIASAVENLTTQILDEGGEDFIKELLDEVARDGEWVKDVFDHAYMGNFGELFIAVYNVMKVNYGPFFKQRLGALTNGSRVMDRVMAKVSTLSKLQTKQD
jgi:hypothetical protein